MALQATILSGTALSAAVDLGGLALARIGFPAVWTAADVTVLVSQDGITFRSYYDDLGNEITIKAAASRAVRLPPLDWDSVRFVQFRSGTGAVPVNQAADRLIDLIVLNWGN